jgi:hypothetical protein
MAVHASTAEQNGTTALRLLCVQQAPWAIRMTTAAQNMQSHQGVRPTAYVSLDVVFIYGFSSKCTPYMPFYQLEVGLYSKELTLATTVV